MEVLCSNFLKKLGGANWLWLIGAIPFLGGVKNNLKES